MKKGVLITSTVGAALFLVAAGLAEAKSNTSPAATISANVVANCNISTSAGNLAFGSYDPTSATPTYASGQVGFKCTKSAVATTYITPGTAGRVFPNTLTFEIYSDSGHSSVYPSTNATGIQFTSTGAANETLVTYYGRISAGQDVAAGGAQTLALTFTVDY